MYYVEQYNSPTSMENDLNSKAETYEPIAVMKDNNYYTVVYRKINKS